jgi:hypothetical protein
MLFVDVKKPVMAHPYKFCRKVNQIKTQRSASTPKQIVRLSGREEVQLSTFKSDLAALTSACEG